MCLSSRLEVSSSLTCDKTTDISNTEEILKFITMDWEKKQGKSLGKNPLDLSLDLAKVC